MSRKQSWSPLSVTLFLFVSMGCAGSLAPPTEDLCFALEGVNWDRQSLSDSEPPEIPRSVRLSERDAAEPRADLPFTQVDRRFQSSESKTAYFDYPTRRDTLRWMRMEGDSLSGGATNAFISFYFVAAQSGGRLVGYFTYAMDLGRWRAPFDVALTPCEGRAGCEPKPRRRGRYRVD